MTTNHGTQSGGERNPSVEFDKSDIGARGILIFFVVLAIFAVAAHVAVLGLYVGMTKIADKHEPETSPLAVKTVAARSGIMTNTANVNIQKFPEPRLLDDDTVELTNLLTRETAALAAPSRQDELGNVHPPIDDAIKSVVSRLPVRAGTTALPNYPGAGREYSYPAAMDDATTQPDKSEGGIPEAAK
jgi:hypothetical protein